jgi:hypothetical protein
LTTTGVAVVLFWMSELDRSWPVATVALGDCTVGTVLWRYGGQSMVTVICKGSFSIVAGGEMSPAPPEPLQRADRQSGGPMSSTRRACELYPQLRAVDVVMTGFAYPPHEGATQASVRLSLQGATGTLLDKLAYAVGARDRATGSVSPLRGPIPLGYERAYGGIGCADNPLGVGFGANADDTPNLVDAVRYDQVASFSAIPAVFPARKHLLGDTPRSALSQPILELPDNFDWSYFQAAPLSQRIASLRGGEWLSLENVFPGAPLVQSRIPQLNAFAQVHSFHGRPLQVPELAQLTIDMVQLDTEEQRCHIVWRGSFPLAEEAAAPYLVVVAGLESPSEPIAWPDRHELGFVERETTVPTVDGVRYQPEVEFGADTVGAELVSVLPLPEGAGSFEGTVALSAGVPMPSPNAAAPFALAAVKSGVRERVLSVPGAPWASSPAASIAAPEFGSMTLSAEAQSEKNEALARARREEEAERARAAELAREREAQAQRAQQAEAEARRVAQEQQEAKEAAERARAEAELRRQQEAEKFKADQRAAELEAERRAAAKFIEKREQTDQVKRNLYGAFKRKT